MLGGSGLEFLRALQAAFKHDCGAFWGKFWCHERHAEAIHLRLYFPSGGTRPFGSPIISPTSVVRTPSPKADSST